jgi:hypothetical protein
LISQRRQSTGRCGDDLLGWETIPWETLHRIAPTGLGRKSGAADRKKILKWNPLDGLKSKNLNLVFSISLILSKLEQLRIKLP